MRPPKQSLKPAGHCRSRPAAASCEILILPDGRLLAHNISPGLARVLAGLNPRDAAMAQRADGKNGLKK